MSAVVSDTLAQWYAAAKAAPSHPHTKIVFHSLELSVDPETKAKRPEDVLIPGPFTDHGVSFTSDSKLYCGGPSGPRVVVTRNIHFGIDLPLNCCGLYLDVTSPYGKAVKFNVSLLCGARGGSESHLTRDIKTVGCGIVTPGSTLCRITFWTNEAVMWLKNLHVAVIDDTPSVVPMPPGGPMGSGVTPLKRILDRNSDDDDSDFEDDLSSTGSVEEVRGGGSSGSSAAENTNKKKQKKANTEPVVLTAAEANKLVAKFKSLQSKLKKQKTQPDFPVPVVKGDAVVSASATSAVLSSSAATGGSAAAGVFVPDKKDHKSQVPSSNNTGARPSSQFVQVFTQPLKWEAGNGMNVTVSNWPSSGKHGTFTDFESDSIAVLDGDFHYQSNAYANLKPNRPQHISVLDTGLKGFWFGCCDRVDGSDVKFHVSVITIQQAANKKLPETYDLVGRWVGLVVVDPEDSLYRIVITSRDDNVILTDFRVMWRIKKKK